MPESTTVGNRPGVRYDQKHGLWVVTLDDPNGFMGLFNDAYNSVARAMYKMGKHEALPYFSKPSAKAQRIQEQLEKYPDAGVLDIENALDEAAQQNLIIQTEKLVSVNAPDWLHIKQMAPKIISPKPSFVKLD